MGDYKFKFSVIIPVYNVENYLADTIESVIVQSIGFEDNIQIILVNDGTPDNSGQICETYQKMYPNNIKYIVKENGGVSSARNLGLEYAEGQYINFLDSDDKWGIPVFEQVAKFFESHEDEVDVVACRIRFFDAKNAWHALDFKFKEGDRVVDITKESDANIIQLSAASTFIRAAAIKESNRFNEFVKYGEDGLFINQIIFSKAKYGVMKSCNYYYRKRPNLTSAIQTQRFDPEFYSISPDLYYSGIIQESVKKFGEVVPYVQNILAYDIGWRVGAVPPEEITSDDELFGKYYDMLKEKLSYVEDKVILKSKVHKRIGIKEALFKIKHDGETLYDKTFFDVDKKSIFFDNIKLCNFKKNHGTCLINICEIDRGVLTIEGLIARWIFECCPNDTVYPVIRAGKKKFKVKLDEYPFSNEGNFFGIKKRYYHFKKKIKIEDWLNEKGVLKVRMALRANGKLCNITVKYGKLVPNEALFERSYRVCEAYIMKCTSECITVTKPENIRKERFKLEMAAQKWLRANKLKDIAKLRLKCLLLRKTVFKGKKLWLISDRFEKAGDNAEAFFRYICSSAVEDKSIVPVFLISKNSPDAERLQKIGRVMYFEDKKYVEYFICADKIISSSGAEFATNPLDKVQRRYVTDMLRSKLIFLQHGIIKDDMSAWLNKFNKNIKMFVTSAADERESIIKGNYYYTKQDVVLTGLARYDLLENNTEKIITVIPTWRKSIKQSYDLNTESVYYDKFVETDYFKFYNSLINNKRLLNVMRDKGYKGVFCLHPIHSKQSIDYQKNDIFDVNDGFVNYKEVFSKSSLLVTDFSSVFFDFGYLRKPIIYSHFDKEEFFKTQAYVEGYFSYEKDGFGPVCYDLDSTVDAIIASIERDCENEQKYLDRIENFYAYSDKKNCERIYKAILRKK